MMILRAASKVFAFVLCLGIGLPAALAAEKPKVVVLGFDGVDGTLVEQFMKDGSLPNMKKLYDEGYFHRMLTSNPGESPVSWACINTGANPGKTNVFGFMRRTLADPAFKPKLDDQGRLQNKDEYEKGVDVTPAIGHMEDVQVSTAQVLPFDPSRRKLYIGGAAAAAFLLVLLILMFLLRANAAVAALLALALGGGAGYGVYRWLRDLPETMPGVACPQKAKNFWEYLDQAGVRTVAIQAAMTTPAEAGPNTRLLSGLGNRDVALGPGTWFVYTTLDFEFSRSTDSGGYLFKIKPKQDRASKDLETFESVVRGPVDFVEEKRRNEEMKRLESLVTATPAGPGREKVKKDLSAKKFDFIDWNEKRKWTTLPMTGSIDHKQKKVTITIGGETQTIAERGWSEYFHPEFQIGPWIKARGATRIHLARCERDEVKLYMTVISWDPVDPWPQMGMSSPPDFIKTLAKEIGTFDTVGWACESQALKDDMIDDQTFMDDIGFTATWRRNLLEHVLAWKDWDCLFQVFGETDRVAHMMYRHFDEQHPLYSAEEADKPIKMLGQTFKKRDAIRAVYKEMDATVGMVLQRIERGDLPKDTALILCSDHGFASFREQVELNRFLVEKGYLKLNDNSTGLLANRGGFDWEHTKAYALGLGSIYINLKGRERHHVKDQVIDGIVDPADYDKVCDEIIAALKDYQNVRAETHNGKRVVSAVHKRADIYKGDFWKEQIDPDGYVRQSGAGDLLVGFDRGYRVAWSTSIGDVDEQPVSDNKNNWSGDHVSVEAELVRGMFLANRKLAQPVDDVSLMDIGPTVLALYGVSVPASMDGKALSLK